VIAVLSLGLAALAGLWWLRGYRLSLRSSRGSTPGRGLRLVLESRHSLVKVHQWPGVSARLVNDGPRPVALIRPGEGSQAGLRAPVLAWSVRRDDDATPHSYVRPQQGDFRCGNISPPGPADRVDLAPGEATPIWLDPSGLVLREPITYRVVLYLENRPGLDLEHWRMLAPASADAWARLASTEAVRLRSNELVLRVVP
jgi:hypothetical protein